MCESEKGYDFSGRRGDYVQCRRCGAKWPLWWWLTNEPSMALVEVSRDPGKGTVIGHELLGPIRPVDFWQKIKVKRLRVEAKKVEKEPDIIEVREVREETNEFSAEEIIHLVGTYCA